jgi:hypothetical protein
MGQRATDGMYVDDGLVGGIDFLDVLPDGRRDAAHVRGALQVLIRGTEEVA